MIVKMDHIDLQTIYPDIWPEYNHHLRDHSTVEVIVVTKFLIVPEKKRILAPPFAWIDRRFFFNGFMAQLSAAENLLYFFLVLVSDKDGLSYYSYDRICEVLKITFDEFIRARDGLVRKNLIAHREGLFQVLILPTRLVLSKNIVEPRHSRSAEAKSLKEIFQNL